MNMEGEQHIAASLDSVWQALNDPDILRSSIPGCQQLDKESDDQFSAIVEVKVGPIGARFKGTVSLTELNPPHGYTLILVGNGGISGSVKGSAKVKLSEVDEGTLISYSVDAQVGGRLAQLGGPLIDATAKQLAGKFFARFSELVSATTATSAATQAPLPAAASAPAKAAPSPRHGFPLVWVLVVTIAALAGFLVGRSQGLGDSDWAGLSIGLLLIVVAAAAFEHGRRTAAPQIVLDTALLRRLLDGDKS